MFAHVYLVLQINPKGLIAKNPSISEGNRIVSINGTNAANMSKDDAVALLESLAKKKQPLMLEVCVSVCRYGNLCFCLYLHLALKMCDCYFFFLCGARIIAFHPHRLLTKSLKRLKDRLHSHEEVRTQSLRVCCCWRLSGSSCCAGPAQFSKLAKDPSPSQGPGKRAVGVLWLYSSLISGILCSYAL